MKDLIHLCKKSADLEGIDQIANVGHRQALHVEEHEAVEADAPAVEDHEVHEVAQQADRGNQGAEEAVDDCPVGWWLEVSITELGMWGLWFCRVVQKLLPSHSHYKNNLP